MKIKQISELCPFINKHGRIRVILPSGQIFTTYGYIKEIVGDHIIWRDNDPDINQQFTFRNVEEFEEVDIVYK